MLLLPVECRVQLRADAFKPGLVFITTLFAQHIHRRGHRRETHIDTHTLNEMLDLTPKNRNINAHNSREDDTSTSQHSTNDAQVPSNDMPALARAHAHTHAHMNEHNDTLKTLRYSATAVRAASVI